jgi:hypothetical protein
MCFCAGSRVNPPMRMSDEQRAVRFGIAYFALLSAVFIVPFWLPESGPALDVILYAAIPAIASLALGWLLNVWRAAWLATLVVAAAIVSDLLWRLGALDRSDEREPVPVIAVVFFVHWFVPAVAGLILLGVAARGGPAAAAAALRQRRLTLRPPGPPRCARG